MLKLTEVSVALLLRHFPSISMLTCNIYLLEALVWHKSESKNMSDVSLVRYIKNSRGHIVKIRRI